MRKLQQPNKFYSFPKYVLTLPKSCPVPIKPWGIFAL